ncbi:ABC transporter-associated protein EcsC [Anaerobacillus arseniciselenatis]|uniref:ABC transporter-associated protein EcsC n=1 Tax=Anaerobacillus arseniciselenatis TaxID=85682 RepID=A0A1S2LHA5_9BACI|nr:EcsC family protein [Anaerobacillus arseniciselenatis]OIJ11902.1 ABC transporter-associated protein EcsC [Anaerobacillus arseniciselenatis]
MYEEKANIELQRWQRKIEKSGSLSKKYTKIIQNKVNEKIPEKVHEVFTTSVKNMVHATLVGAEYTTTTIPVEGATLEEREVRLEQKVKAYKKTAAVEGAGTGAGGILLGMVDFPLLLSIKMKFLFEAASLYGYDVKDYRERLYILYLFQLAFSSDEKKKEVLKKIKDWEEIKRNLPDKETYLQQIDWKEFQLEYRDHIDLIKLLQVIPGFGAIVGAFANYHFLEVLGETAKNSYRMRVLGGGS